MDRWQQNFIPDCDLTSGATQDFTASGGDLCGPWTRPTFNTAGGLDQFSTELTTGFGHRPFNWEFSAGVQHELLPRLSVEVSYFRRIWGNFSVTDNSSPRRLTTRRSTWSHRSIRGCPTAAATP